MAFYGAWCTERNFRLRHSHQNPLHEVLGICMVFQKVVFFFRKNGRAWQIRPRNTAQMGVFRGDFWPYIQVMRGHWRAPRGQNRNFWAKFRNALNTLKTAQEHIQTHFRPPEVISCDILKFSIFGQKWPKMAKKRLWSNFCARPLVSFQTQRSQISHVFKSTKVYAAGPDSEKTKI